MYRTALNIFCLSAALIFSACSKEAEDTAASDESIANDELPIDESEDEGSEEEDSSDDSEEDGSGTPDGDPPADEDEGSEDAPEDDTTEDAAEEEAGGAYTGDMTITINTSFGPDTCAGLASVDVTEDGILSGTGSCSFGILGAQSPTLAGTVAEDGTVNASVDLSAFGTSFTLDWNGFKDENTLIASYNGTDSLVGVGDIDYEIVINLEVETTAGAEEGSSLSEYIDFSAPGDTVAFLSSSTYTSTDGCELEYDLYTPEAAVTDTLTVIQHGFARSKNEFTELANHLASWGMPAVVMDLCHAWAFDVDINQNGADVVDLVNNIWEGPVVYMGHSNGAISSLVSASMDERAVGVLGLALVERLGGDRTGVASALEIPAIGIFGEANRCNTWNSGLDAYQAVPGVDLFRTTEADHCDFEAPTGTVCTLACSGSNDLFTDDAIRSNILGLGTAYISWQALGDEDAMEWADPTGGARAALESMGAISAL